MRPRGRITIDPFSIYAKTDESGTATFYLKFTEGY